MVASQITVLGFDDSGRAAGIPRHDQIHAGVFGEVGSGKSTVDTILISQNMSRNEGFLVLDPHGSLAHDVLRMVPDSQRDRVVYISLDSVARWGKSVKINPLEVNDESQRYVVAMNLVNALRNIYRDSWGPQLESLLRNGANALVEIEGSTLRDLVKIITDERTRAVKLAKVANRDVKHFWSVLFPQQYQKDAGRSAYNKLDKIMSIPQVAAMLDTPQSTVDFADVLESGKWVIIDLSSGGSDDVISFVGTILVNMVYVEAKKRFSRPAGELRPFFMYIDEAHLFAPFVLRELLNTMRKANVKVVMTSQTVNTFPREFAREISALVRTIICFKVDMETASMFKTVMPVSVETLTSMTHGRFAFYSQGDPPLSGLLKAVPIVDRERDWIGLAEYSVGRYGQSTLLEKYILPTKALGESPDLTPLEAFILLLLYNEKREMTRDEICESLQKMFCVQRRDVFERLDDMLVNKFRLVEKRSVLSCEGGDALTTKYALSVIAYNSVFSNAATGRRAGSDLHLATIFLIMEIQQKNFKFCIPDLGDSAKPKPDLLIFEPQILQDRSGNEFNDPLCWSDRVIAVEVETDPAKHGSQVVKNFQKNFDLGYDVWFVVFSQKSMQYVIDIMTQNEVDKNLYKIVQILPDTVESLSCTQNGSVAHLTMDELVVRNALGEGGTAGCISGRTGISSYDVMGILWRLEKKGMAERGYAETKSTVTAGSGTATCTKRQEYFVPTEQGKMLDRPVASGNVQGGQQGVPEPGGDKAVQPEMRDFTKLTDDELKSYVLDPTCGGFAKKLLENRGYCVLMENNTVELRRNA